MENSNDNINTAITTTTNSSIVSVENLNNVANWVSATVISAFFSSLERFSCVNVATMDPDDDDDDDEAQDRPLALSTNQHLQHNDVANLPGFCVNCLHFMEMLPALVDPRTGMRKIIDMFSSRMMRRRNGYTNCGLPLKLLLLEFNSDHSENKDRANVTALNSARLLKYHAIGLNYPTHGTIVAERVGFECILNYIPQAPWSGRRHSITLEEYWIQTSIYHSHSASCLYILFVIFALTSCLDVVLCGSYIYTLYTGVFASYFLVITPVKILGHNFQEDMYLKKERKTVED
ncbi:hypothetical protein Peur_003609 [Populus x canadensis]